MPAHHPRTGTMQLYGHDGVTADERGGPSAARVTDGRLVLARARWRLAASLLRHDKPGSLAHLDELDRLRAEHGLPAQLFAHFGGKPVYVDLTSPHLIALLHKELGDHNGSVALVETLPGKGQWWLRDRDGRQRVSEFATLIRLDGGRDD